MPTRTIPKNSDLHKKIVAMLSSRVKLAKAAHTKQVDTWSAAEDSILAYVNETASDTLRRNRRDAGDPQYTTISIPYTYAQVMAAHTYWTSVFFARTPIHQFTGRHGEGEMSIQAVESLIDYQVQVGHLIGPYYIWLYDAAKYGVGILGSYWDNQVIQYGQIAPGEDGRLMQTSFQLQGYQGNTVYNVSPFDFMKDPRVSMTDFQKGEFCICKKQVSWNDVVRRKAQRYFMNTEHLVGPHAPADSGTPSSSNLVRPEKTPSQEIGFDSGDGVRHPTVVHVYEIYVDLLQTEWGLGSSTYPEKWVFTLTQDLSLLLGAEPLGAIHGLFPFDVAEPEVEAYADYNRGIPEIMRPIQNTVDWLWNSHAFNVRAALNNQFIGDPSRIMMRDVENSGQPGFFFRVRPEAYGQDVNTMLKQIPVTDVTRAHMDDLDSMFGIGERVLGINDQILGALSGGGGRKTATEVRTSTGFGVNRLKTISEYISAQAFGPHAQKLLQTSQQYYDSALKMRIVGDAAAMAGAQFHTVDPQAILGQFDFVHVDGTLPIDRLAQANLWKELMMAFRFMPSLLQQYDLAKIFAYTAQVAGLKNIHQFRLQLGDPAQLQQAAQAGNVVPISAGGSGGGRSGNPNSSTESGLSALSPNPGA